MTAAEAVARARRSLGHGCKYELGKGGMDPAAEFPWDNESMCDCCLAEGTMVWTIRRGLVPIEEIRVGDQMISRSDVHGGVESPMVHALLPRGRQRTLKIKNPSNSILATENHPFLVIRNGRRDRRSDGTMDKRHHDIVWKKAGELEPGDVLVKPKERPRPVNPLNLPTSLGFLLGVFLGDGSVSGVNGFHVCVYGDLSDRIRLILMELFECRTGTSKTHGISGSSKTLRMMLEVSGLAVESHVKRVPEWIWNTSKDFIRAFIDGCISSDGSFQKDRTYTAWSFGSCNERMLRQVRGLCQVVHYRTSDVVVHERTRPIVIKGRLVKSAKPLYTFEVYPNSARTGQEHFKTKAASIGSDFILTRVSGVSEYSVLETYDLVVEAPNNFVANDLVVHNSGFTMWGIGKSRHDHGLWMNTDAIVADANHPGGLFDIVTQESDDYEHWVCSPGDLIVFPRQARTSHGHVGIVVAGTTMLDCRVIHCSGGNAAKPWADGKVDAIRETSSLVWRGRQGMVFARPAFYDPPSVT